MGTRADFTQNEKNFVNCVLLSPNSNVVVIFYLCVGATI